MWYSVSPEAVARSMEERLETRLKEHWDAHTRKMMEKSVVADHA